MKSNIIMPKGTALWLKMHTKLSIEQILDFCKLDFLTLNSINYVNTAVSNPLATGQLNEEEIKKAEKNSEYRMKNALNLKQIVKQTQRKYISLAKRGEGRERAIAWVLLNTTDIEIKKIAQLFGTTSTLVKKVQLKIEDTETSFSPLDPVQNGYCSAEELDILKNEKIKKK